MLQIDNLSKHRTIKSCIKAKESRCSMMWLLLKSCGWNRL